MKFAFLFALLWVAAVGLVMVIGDSHPPEFKGEYIPQRRIVTNITTTPCRWDDLCNGHVSPARLAAHKNHKVRP